MDGHTFMHTENVWKNTGKLTAVILFSGAGTKEDRLGNGLSTLNSTCCLNFFKHILLCLYNKRLIQNLAFKIFFYAKK